MALIYASRLGSSAASSLSIQRPAMQICFFGGIGLRFFGSWGFRPCTSCSSFLPLSGAIPLRFFFKTSSCSAMFFLLARISSSCLAMASFMLFTAASVKGVTSSSSHGNCESSTSSNLAFFLVCAPSSVCFPSFPPRMGLPLPSLFPSCHSLISLCAHCAITICCCSVRHSSGNAVPIASSRSVHSVFEASGALAKRSSRVFSRSAAFFASSFHWVLPLPEGSASFRLFAAS